jgi:hypothetical protein
MKKYLIAAGLAFLTFTGLAVSQTISVPQVSIVNPTDLFQIIPLGKPSAQSIYATPAQITSQSGYYKSTPASLFTFTFGNSQSYAAFQNASALAYGYVTFAPAPSDGSRECLFSIGGVTTLYLSANTSQTLDNAITTMAANTGYCYLFSLSNTTWDRN